MQIIHIKLKDKGQQKDHRIIMVDKKKPISTIMQEFKEILITNGIKQD